MHFATVNGTTLHYAHRAGDARKRPVVFLNSLGTDLRIWDAVIASLPPDLPILGMDKRGHGLSDVAPITMEAHVGDAAALMEMLGIRDALICGVSVGGMIAQGLAATRPDLCAGLMLCNTAHRIGTAETWNARIDTIRADGIEALAEPILERWFSAAWRAANPAALSGYRNMLTRTPSAGYTGTCAAIRDTDLEAGTGSLDLPVRCIAGTEDLSTPPDLVRSLADLIPGATYRCIEGVGHLPGIEAPQDIAADLLDFHAALG